ncbi:PQQ-binding-like beta-propeller repeat protein [Nonomuraea sp. NPDC005692]|uniref:outer membrane protein assembly factor BamB family protein n=1 Tax=Nonomuraea sp. NPDC005692 TaxID=3157168 RepID=UPI0033DE53F9
MTALLLGVAADAAGGRPVPVQWRMAWSVPAPTDQPADPYWDFDVPVSGASTDVLAIVDGENAVRVHDARTGRLVRTQRLSGAEIAGVWVTSGTVVVLTGELFDGEKGLQAFDAATGATLWRRDLAFDQESDDSPRHYFGPRIMVTDGGVVIAERRSEPLTLLSLDPRSGAVAARTVHQRNCDLTAAAGARSLLLLDHCGGNRVRLSSVVPSTLRVRWSRTMPSPIRDFPVPEGGRGADLAVTVSRDGYAEVDGTFYAPDGRRLPTPREAPRAVGSAGSGRWSEPLRLDDARTMTDDDGDPELSYGRSTRPLPVFLTSLDLRTGRLHSLPLDMPFARLVGTAPGTAFVEAAGRVAAYTLVRGIPTGRELFDGVPPEAWLDACGLLNAADLRPIADGYTPSPAKPRLFGTRLPHPPSCDWIPPTDDAPVISLDVVWVSSSSAKARRIYAIETAGLKEHWAYDVTTHDPYLLDYLYPTAIGSNDAPEALVSAGPVIIRLTSTSRSALRLLASLVRDELLARYRLARPVSAPLPQLRWSFPADGRLQGAPTVRGDTVYAAGGGRVYAVDAFSGHPRWSRAISDHVSGPLRFAGDLVYAQDPFALYALDTRTGRPRWRYQSQELGNHFRATRGRIIVCAGDETVALDAATGRRLWRFRTADGCDRSRFERSGDIVYVTGSATVYALDVFTGHLRWSVRPGADDRADIQVASAGKVVYVAGADGRIRALDAATGAQRWSTRFGGALVSALLPSGAAVYVSTADHEVHALDARTGRKRWTAPIGDADPDLGLTVGQGRLYVVTSVGIVSALDAATGSERWYTPVGGVIVVGPAVHDGVVYVSTAGGTVHALDGATGARRWHMNTGDAPDEGAIVGNALVHANGLLYTGGGGNVYALRP